MSARTEVTDHTGLQAALVGEIRAELARQRKTVRAVANHLAYTPQGTHNLLTGQRKLTVNHLAAIAELLGVSPADLLARAEAQLTVDLEVMP